MSSAKEFTINPCESCIKHMHTNDGDCNVNTLSECVYETLGAYTGEINPLVIHQSSEGRNAIECVESRILAEGKTPCSLRVPPKPIIPKAPHYFPELATTLHDKALAYKKCVSMCDGERTNRKQCYMNCDIDRDALISGNIVERYDDEKDDRKDRKVKKREKREEKVIKKNMLVYILAVSIVAFPLIYLLILFIYELKTTTGKRSSPRKSSYSL